MQNKKVQKTDRMLNLGIGMVVSLFVLGFGRYTMPKENERQDRIRESSDSISLERANAVMAIHVIPKPAKDTIKASERK